MGRSSLHGDEVFKVMGAILVLLLVVVWAPFGFLMFLFQEGATFWLDIVEKVKNKESEKLSRSNE